MNNNNETDSKTMTDLQRMAEAFQTEMIVKRDKSEIEFYMEYIASDSDKKEIEDQYSTYLLEQQAGDEDPDDILNKDEWLDEVYYVENWDDIYDMVQEYHDPLSIETYTSDRDGDAKIIEVMLWCGWPNIYLHIETRWEKVLWQWGWWGETHELNLSYLYDTISPIYNIDY